MAQVQVYSLLAPIAQVCRGCNNTTMIAAYIDAARELCARSRWFKSTLLGSTTAPITTDYTTGTVTVTNNSAAVVGSGTLWLAEVDTGDTFTGPDGEPMIVLDVSSNTALTLTTAYAGSTLAGQAYTIGRSRGTALYNLGSDTYNEIVGISAVQMLYATSLPATRDLIERKSGEWNPDDPPAKPEYYQYVPQAQLALTPTPDAVYILTIGLVLQPKIGSNSIDDSLLVKWSRALERGTLAYLLDLPGLPWSNERRAKRYADEFEADIRSASSDAQSAYNAGAQLSARFGASTGLTGRELL